MLCGNDSQVLLFVVSLLHSHLHKVHTIPTKKHACVGKDHPWCHHRSVPVLVNVSRPLPHRVAAAHRRLLVGKAFDASSPNGRFIEGAAAITGKPLTRIEVCWAGWEPAASACFKRLEELVIIWQCWLYRLIA